MLLLMTLALVVASAILLILGFVQDALGFIYVSMVCAGVAGTALYVFHRLTRRRAAVVTGTEISAGLASSRQAAPVGAGRLEPRSAEREWFEPEPVPEEPEREPEPAIAETTAELEAISTVPASVEEPQEATWSDWGEEVVFPIDGYDDLRAAEILPLLNRLDPDELQEVRDRELTGKARATILDRIDDRLGRRAAPRPTPAAVPEPAPQQVLPEPEPSASVRAPEPAPAKSVDKAPAKAPAKKALAEKAPAKKAPAKLSATKAAGTKTPAKKAPAKAAAVTKAPAEAAKAAAVTKTPAEAAKPPSRASKAANKVEEPAAKAASPAKKASKKAAPSNEQPPAKAEAPAKKAAKKRTAPAPPGEPAPGSEG